MMEVAAYVKEDRLHLFQFFLGVSVKEENTHTQSKGKKVLKIKRRRLHQWDSHVGVFPGPAVCFDRQLVVVLTPPARVHHRLCTKVSIRKYSALLSFTSFQNNVEQTTFIGVSAHVHSYVPSPDIRLHSHERCVQSMW